MLACLSSDVFEADLSNLVANILAAEARDFPGNGAHASDAERVVELIPAVDVLKPHLCRMEVALVFPCCRYYLLPSFSLLVQGPTRLHCLITFLPENDRWPTVISTNCPFTPIHTLYCPCHFLVPAPASRFLNGRRFLEECRLL